MTLLDRASGAYLLLRIVFWLTPLNRLVASFAGWLFILFLIAVGYLLVRLLRWARKRLLWGLRNRLIVAYLFIAVVPVVLLFAFIGLSGYFLFFQLGAHLIHDDLDERISYVASIADTLEKAFESEHAKGAPEDHESVLALPGISAVVAAARQSLSGLEIHLPSDPGATPRTEPKKPGLVQSGGKLWIEAAVRDRAHPEQGVLYLRCPVTAVFLDKLAPDLGPIQLTIFRPVTKSDSPSDTLSLNGLQLVPAGQLLGHRPLQASRSWIDVAIPGGSTLDAALLDSDSPAPVDIPVAAAFSVRPSQLIQRLFASLGAFRDPLVIGLVLILIFFLALEIAALITGIVLTRTITIAVDDLYEATRHVRQGDFRHRIHVRQKDQLGVLADSFNAMTGSISELIEEQRQRQRLENELTIAHEVQEQLFPRQLPSLPGLELAAVCRAARVVSGDYYDFMKLGQSSIGMAIADISGKGISAALLMASLQAALRSQAMLDGHRTTGEVVASLNKHLYLNTSDDRYATLFYAEYDRSARTLRYTNAGHVAPFFVWDGQVKKLDEGGTVVGLFDHADYLQSTVKVEAGAVFVGFSDGLLEPENVYGEEFGSTRLASEVLRLRDAPVQRIADSLLSAVEQWAGTPEQADDMTVIVARFC
ncbi:MAG TPA: SpoIIE family protein phosphatase [Candidatus Acidoferrales bacterium]|nr:SpoIIE family protein phosphatase [Candidatus Acidoferrales bacterium]